MKIPQATLGGRQHPLRCLRYLEEQVKKITPIVTLNLLHHVIHVMTETWWVTRVGVINERKTNHAINAINDSVSGRFVIWKLFSNNGPLTVSVIRIWT